MSSYEQIIQRWLDRELKKTVNSNLASSMVIADTGIIYSFGRHFPLVITMRDKKRRIKFFLLNGDNYSQSTSRHQELVRRVLKTVDIPKLIIPFSVLEAAGIEPDDVRLINVTPDRIVDVPHIEKAPPKYRCKTYTVDAEGFPELRNHALCAFDGENFRWHTQRHWLGEALIEADVKYQVKCKDYVAGQYTAPHPDTIMPWPDFAWIKDRQERLAAEETWSKSADGQVRDAADKTYWNSYQRSTCPRHKHCNGWITRRRTAKYLSGFDHNEAHDSYFFCELPAKTKARTVDEAYLALKPKTVLLAEDKGYAVKRQGDIFAIPTSLAKRELTKRGAVFAKNGPIFGTNHQATEVALLPDGTTLVRGILRHVPDGRRADHARVTLGKEFHILVKNTVPISV